MSIYGVVSNQEVIKWLTSKQRAMAWRDLGYQVLEFIMPIREGSAALVVSEVDQQMEKFDAELRATT